MSAKTILLALGGNAILQANQPPTYENQRDNVAVSSQFLVKLAQQGHRLVITHGNGPQVGTLLLQNEEAQHVTPAMPLDVLSGQSQGFIGYMLQQCLTNDLIAAGMPPKVACLLTRVAVDTNDPAFANPTKPVGLFYDAATAAQLAQDKGWTVKEDPVKGWRRVVASPKPTAILEIEAVRSLLEQGFITISCGGGGIPVIPSGLGYTGVEAVIDKDLSGACLAEATNADMFLIVTDVENACVYFGTEKQQALGEVSVTEMERYTAEGHFLQGSMGPKVEAALSFTRRTGKTAIICALHKIDQAVAGSGGTRIVAE